MIQAMRDAFVLPDLRKKILFTFLILVVYRLGAHVPVPGVNLEALQQLFESNQLLGLLDLLSGGAMANFSVMAMGVYPYITASIILQLLQPIIPQLERLQQEGEQGRRKINQWTHYLTVPLAALNAYGQAVILTQASAGAPVLDQFGFGVAPLSTLAIIISMTAGTVFAVWLGELISEQGIGNGVSIIILGGILTRVPQRVLGLAVAQNWLALILFVIITAVTVLGIVVIQEGQRRIPVQYGKRVLGMRGNRLRMAGGMSTHVPLKVNMAGMIPLILAQSLMIFPGTVASYFLNSSNAWVQWIAERVDLVFNPQHDIYWPLYFVTVVAFTYFYTYLIFEQQNLPDSLRRQGGFIPGIRPGKRTADYLNAVLRRITLVGAVFLGLVAILPWLVRDVTQTNVMLITSTGLLIVVGVVLDTMRQLEAQLQMRHYDRFLRRGILG
jgi:preprotein translocase subunit SecY